KPAVIATGKTDQLTVPVYENSQFVGKQIARIDWPQNTLIKAVYRDGKYVIPSGQTIIKAGDALVITLDAGSRGQVFRQLRQMQGVEYDG
ncbi:ClC family H(+)/Cl(-) exchange transporter, partial [Lactobacillus sp. XV13L]|nr:ClC family H(+)/Cl(-) exchange transporter [Lactobacillus sp. XV13L]